ncbi:MAG: 4'-phosphopantetheinyl transferase superfamily protein, partial [Bacteroidia bacterium]|nr:4'-phosphopantetheinyl transferase superfamily protein [Bacteroidia bacterium]
MIGNDIVSLERTGLQPRSENPRFLSRVLTAQEHQLLSQQPDKERALWTLWALKESTYKLEYRAQQRRFFAPKRYECVRWCCGASGFPERAWVTTPDGCYDA